MEDMDAKAAAAAKDVVEKGRALEAKELKLVSVAASGSVLCTLITSATVAASLCQNKNVNI